MQNSFLKVFPPVVALPHLLIGSNEPIPMDRDAIGLFPKDEYSLTFDGQ